MKKGIHPVFLRDRSRQVFEKTLEELKALELKLKQEIKAYDADGDEERSDICVRELYAVAKNIKIISALM